MIKQVETSRRETPGNVAAIREALEEIIIISYDIERGFPDVRAVAKAALAKPPRNCDVGSAEEQLERYDKFCGIHNCRHDCPLINADSCELAWAQMPYEAKEGSANNG